MCTGITLDFGGTLGSIFVKHNVTLSFQDLTLAGAASQQSYNASSRPFPVVSDLKQWPSLVAEVGTTVCQFSIMTDGMSEQCS